MDYVLCVRNPADVAASLARRDIKDLYFEDSIALWLHYVRAALENTQGQRRLILCFEDYFIDTDRQIRRLAEFVCGPSAQLSDETHDRVESFIEPELWRNRDSVEKTSPSGRSRPTLPVCMCTFPRPQPISSTGTRHKPSIVSNGFSARCSGVRLDRGLPTRRVDGIGISVEDDEAHKQKAGWLSQPPSSPGRRSRSRPPGPPAAPRWKPL